MEPKLTRQIRILQVYAGILTLALAVLAVLFFRQGSQKPHFTEIDAERINIVEANGALKMVISNKQRQHPGIVDGKVLPPRDRPAGMIFFNTKGDECGGLVFDGDPKEAGMTYSIDQFNNDQIMQLQYDENSGSDGPSRSYGLKMWDEKLNEHYKMHFDDSLQRLHDTAAVNAAYRKIQADGSFMAQRLFLGKTRNKEVGLFIRDDKGRPRLRIGLDSLNQVVFQALDSNGRLMPVR